MTKRKHYRDLSIDEPVSHVVGYEEVEAELRSASPEQIKAWMEEAWFTNPGGHCRRRLLRKYERAGILRIVVTPDGREQIEFLDDQRTPADDFLIDLLMAVGGVLDEPYDPERTRAHYESCA